MKTFDDNTAGKLHSKCGIVTFALAPEATILDADDLFYEVLTCSKSEVMEQHGGRLLDFVAEDERQSVLASIENQLAEKCSFSVELKLISKGRNHASLVMAGHFTSEQEIWAIIFDDTVKKDRDDLTKLLSISKFQLDAMELFTRNASSKFLIINTDFEKFKIVNDTFGYQVGNSILTDYADILGAFITEGELACRYYADNFLLLLQYSDKPAVIDRLRLLEKQVVSLQKHKYKQYNLILTSALYFIEDYEDEDSYDIVSIIDRVNTTRKTVKGSHKNSYAIYNDAIFKRINFENSLESRMNDALENHEFVVFFQPKIRLTDKKIVGAEALVRWQEQSGRLIPPNDFIPLFERNGFITLLDFYVYDYVCQTIRRWIDSGRTPLPVSVNVSRVHFKSNLFFKNFNDIIDKYQIPHSLIEIELTESMFLDDITRISDVMNMFKQQGYLISIDDFGSGYSSLNILKQLPADILKLDKDFFKDECVDSKEKTIVSYVIHMAKELNLQVLSEGVETQAQEDFLLDSNCDMAQGFLFAKPMPVKDFEELVDRFR